MTTWPIYRPAGTPIAVYAPAAGDVAVTIWAEPYTAVLAPVAGDVVYVGDGTVEPWQGNGPGVVGIIDDDRRWLHVLGYLDRDLLASTWRGLTWNKYIGDVKPKRSLLNWGGLVDLFKDRGAYPSPHVSEGAVIGRTANHRPGLRWSMIELASAAPTIPTAWTNANAMRPPTYIPTTTPAAAPIVPIAPARKPADNSLLWAAGILAGVLVLRRKRRNRR